MEMTKSDLFEIINDSLDGDGLIVTDNDLIVRAINGMEDVPDDERWADILEEYLEEEDCDDSEDETYTEPTYF